MSYPSVHFTMATKSQKDIAKSIEDSKIVLQFCFDIEEDGRVSLTQIQ